MTRLITVSFNWSASTAQSVSACLWSDRIASPLRKVAERFVPDLYVRLSVRAQLPPEVLVDEEAQSVVGEERRRPRQVAQRADLGEREHARLDRADASCQAVTAQFDPQR